LPLLRLYTGNPIKALFPLLRLYTEPLLRLYTGSPVKLYSNTSIALQKTKKGCAEASQGGERGERRGCGGKRRQGGRGSACVAEEGLFRLEKPE
jgi:hypothetical protein